MKTMEENQRSYYINSKLDNSDSYDKKYMKIKFNSDDNLPLKKMLEFCNIMINCMKIDFLNKM